MNQRCHRQVAQGAPGRESGGTLRKEGAKSIQQRVSARLAMLALLSAASAAHAQTAPAATESAVKAVRIVCMAEQMETLLSKRYDTLHKAANIYDLLSGSGKDARVKAARILKAKYPPAGPWSFLPAGTGFVVHHGKENSYVVTNWHIAASCPTAEGKRVQLAIIEPTGSDIQPVLADTFTANDSGALLGTKALCRDDSRPCGVELPSLPALKPGTAPSASQKDGRGGPVTDEERLKQLENLYIYAPDVAVLKTRALLSVPTVRFDVAELVPDTTKTMTISGFPQVAMQMQQERSGTRRGLAEQISTSATYSRPIVLDNTRPGLHPDAVIKAELLLLAAQIHRGNSGSPVLANGAVVGMITAMVTSEKDVRTALTSAGTEDAAVNNEVSIASGYGLAVRAADVVKVLDFLGVPHQSAASKPGVTGVVAASAPSVVAASSISSGGASAKQPDGFDNPIVVAVAVLAVLAMAAVGVAVYLSKTNKAAAAPKLDPGTIDKTLVAPAMPSPQPPISTPAAAPAQKPAAAASGKSPVRLIAANGPVTGSYNLPTPNGNPSLFVGRDPKSCQLVFPNQHDMVSGIHCCFSWTPQTATLTVRDLSSGGTYVNGKRIEKSSSVVLRSGDTVDLGAPNMNRFVVEIS